MRPITLSVPPISYPISRDFQWPWIHWLGYGGLLIGIALLVPLNYALQGYDTISSWEQDFNTTSTYWFNRAWFRPTPGSQCEPHIFSVGDSFVTSTGIFVWTLAGILHTTNSNISSSGGFTAVKYGASSLDYCDTRTIAVAADTTSWRASVTAAIRCDSPEFSIWATTTVNAGFFDVTNLIYLEEKEADKMVGMRFFVQQAAEDLLQQMNVLNADSDTDYVITTFAQNAVNDVGWCPRAASNDLPYNSTISLNPLGCSDEASTDTPILTYRNPNTNLSVSDYTFSNVSDHYLWLTSNAVNNTMQVMHAAIRLDLGNVLPNNVFTNTSAVMNYTETIQPAVLGDDELDPLWPFASIGLFDWLMGSQNAANLTLPLDPEEIRRPPQIVVPYLCHLSVPKSPGSAFISVLVATLAMMSSAWGLFIMIASWFATQRGGHANYCEYHAPRPVTPIFTIRASRQHKWAWSPVVLPSLRNVPRLFTRRSHYDASVYFDVEHKGEWDSQTTL